MGGARGIRAHNSSLSAALEAIVARAMALSRDARYPSATHFATDLLALRGGVGARLEPRVSKSESPTTSTPFTSEAQSRPPRAASRSNAALYLLGALAGRCGRNRSAVGHAAITAFGCGGCRGPKGPDGRTSACQGAWGRASDRQSHCRACRPRSDRSAGRWRSRCRAQRSEAEVAARRSRVEAQSPEQPRLPVAQPKPSAVNEAAPRPEQSPPVLRTRPARERDEARIKPPKSPEPLQPAQAPATCPPLAERDHRSLRAIVDDRRPRDNGGQCKRPQAHHRVDLARTPAVVATFLTGLIAVQALGMLGAISTRVSAIPSAAGARRLLLGHVRGSRSNGAASSGSPRCRSDTEVCTRWAPRSSGTPSTTCARTISKRLCSVANFARHRPACSLHA